MYFFDDLIFFGQVAKWPTATDCKSVLFGVRWFESILAHSSLSGSSSFGRASAFQAEGGRFEPGLPLKISVGFDYKPM